MPCGSYLEETVDTNIDDTLFAYLQTSGEGEEKNRKWWGGMRKEMFDQKINASLNPCGKVVSQPVLSPFPFPCALIQPWGIRDIFRLSQRKKKTEQLLAENLIASSCFVNWSKETPRSAPDNQMLSKKKAQTVGRICERKRQRQIIKLERSKQSGDNSLLVGWRCSRASDV
jgi:hypothetical protein